MARSILGLGMVAVLTSALAGCGAKSTPLAFDDFARSARADNPSGLEGPDCDSRCAERRLEFRYVVYVGNEIYCYWNEKRAETGLDYDRLASELETTITTSSTLTDYYRTLRRWAAAFHDGHVNVMPPDDFAGLDVYSSPVRIEAFSPGTERERVFVTESQQRALAEVGDQIIAVNGTPVSDAITEGEAEASGSTRRMRRFGATRRLLDALGTREALKPARVTLERAGRRIDVELPRRVTVAVSRPSGRDAAPPAPEKTGVENIRANILPNGVGYLRIDGFSGSQSEAVLDSAMRSLAPARALVIDLRMNGGGDLSGNRILGRLVGRPLTRFERSERLSGIYFAQRPDEFMNMGGFAPGAIFGTWRPVRVEPITEGSFVGKRVAALTSTFCFSACDTFTAALRANGLARIFGEATGGGTGTPYVFPLPKSGFQFRYSVVRGRTLDGQFIEGRGTEPDELVDRSPADIGRDQDQQMARAIAWAAADTAGPGLLPASFVDESLALSGSVVQAFGSIWRQPLEVAPTIHETQTLLRRRGGRDELAP